jgi:tRNA (uracil-5-)-methyltransferase
MECRYFGECGSCRLYDLSYGEQVELKKNRAKELFAKYDISDFEFFTSNDEHYRNRAEFRVWHEGDKIYYGMHRLEGKDILKIENCPKVDEQIFALMPKLREYIEKDEILRHRLYSIEFLSAKEGVLVTLIYHKPIDKEWSEVAKKLEEIFGIFIIGRSRKIKKVLSQDYVIDALHVEGKEYRYKIAEGSFSQPNKSVNEKMLSWVSLHVENPKDLLELYCGHGNFTIPLSRKFDSVLATEISKNSIKSANYNCELNGVKNISFLRMSVEELTSAMKKEREFNRLKEIDLDSFDFSHVLTDPPRAGIDAKSLDFISQFENIIYISCNLETLKRDIDVLSKDFKIVKFALFDQFVHTNHIESGVILKRKR